MTQQEKIVRLATEVMGWEVVLSDLDGDCDAYILLGDVMAYDGDGNEYAWNPFERWDHAGMLVEKITTEQDADFELSACGPGGNDRYGCWFSKEMPNMAGTMEFCVCAFAPTGPAAISEAALATIEATK